MANGDMVENLTYTGTDDGGISFALSQSKTTSSTVRVQKQRVVVDSAGEITLLTINATETGSAFSSISKVVIRNLDSTNFVRIGRASAGDAIYEKLPAGDFMVINDVNIEAVTTPGFVGYTALTSVVAQADTADVDVELFVFRT
jgi:hypothetical protein